MRKGIAMGVFEIKGQHRDGRGESYRWANNRSDATTAKQELRDQGCTDVAARKLSKSETQQQKD